LQAFGTVIGLMALVKTMLAPKQPMWRIFPANDEHANRLLWRAWGMAFVYGLDRFLAAVNSALSAPIPVTIAQSFLTTVTVALLMVAMLRVRLVSPEQHAQLHAGEAEQEPEQAEAGDAEAVTPRRAPTWLRILLWILTGTILVAV